MFDEYEEITGILIKLFGASRLPDDLKASDFASLWDFLAKKWGPTRLKNSIIRARSVFKFAYDFELIDRPIRCLQPRSSVFSIPSAKTLRQQRSTRPRHALSPADCRKLVEAAPVPFRAMILLGLNCGYGAHDCATLPRDAVDLDKALIKYDRLKTGIERKATLWPETVMALRDVVVQRPKPKTDDAKPMLFVMDRGTTWLTNNVANPICNAVRRLMKDVGVHREGYGPYSFRKIFRTISDETKDMPAIDLIMGHADHTMGGRYRQTISDARLKAVTDHVRAWYLS